MTRTRQSLGRRGETLARDLLLRENYTILTTNWRCPQGELDIVARQHDTIVFVEVRTRYADAPDASFESVNARKQSKLADLAYLYLEAHQMEAQVWRVDVIAVAIPPSGSPILEHVEDALDW